MNYEILSFLTIAGLWVFCFISHLRISEETKQNKDLKKQMQRDRELLFRYIVYTDETVDRMLCLENKLGARDTEKDIPAAPLEDREVDVKL